MGDKMISVIKLDNKLVDLIKKQPKQKIKIAHINLSYYDDVYENISIEGYRKTNTDDFYYEDFIINSNEPIELYIIFNTQVPDVIITLNPAQFNLLQQHISYGIVDTELSVKYNTIFYLSA